MVPIQVAQMGSGSSKSHRLMVLHFKASTHWQGLHVQPPQLEPFLLDRQAGSLRHRPYAYYPAHLGFPSLKIQSLAELRPQLTDLTLSTPAGGAASLPRDCGP